MNTTIDKSSINENIALMLHLKESGVISRKREYIEDIDTYNENYEVLTDDEATERAGNYIKDSLWAFNASFLANYTNLDICIFEALSEKCEDTNDSVLSLIESTGDINDFVDEAIAIDGRGHFISSYDSDENEITHNKETYYIYRLN